MHGQPSDSIADDRSAISIAEKAVSKKYGERALAGFRPWTVERPSSDTWLVVSTKATGARLAYPTTRISVEISRTSGEVTRIQEVVIGAVGWEKNGISRVSLALLGFLVGIIAVLLFLRSKKSSANERITVDKSRYH